MLARTFAPLFELFAQGSFGDTHRGELIHGVAEGHHDALVPGQSVPFMAPEAMDESQARILAGPQGSGHEAHQEISTILQERPQQMVRLGGHG